MSPAFYSYQQHYVYDLAGNPVGLVDKQGNIFSLSGGQLIGYIVF